MGALVERKIIQKSMLKKKKLWKEFFLVSLEILANYFKKSWRNLFFCLIYSSQHSAESCHIFRFLSISLNSPFNKVRIVDVLYISQKLPMLIIVNNSDVIDFSEGHNLLTALNSWYLSLVRGKDSECKVTTWYSPFDFDLNMHFFIPNI